ncbi:MAG: glycosyltransferase [Acidobacteria bacterium]|nr:glycosyltransferase [Acidobacteriota bacterium]
MMQILFVTGRYPFPPLKGDQLRAFHQIAFLARRHAVTLVSFAEGKRTSGSDPLPELCTRVVTVEAPGAVLKVSGVLASFARGEPLQNGLYRSAAMRRACARLGCGARFDVAVVQLMRMFQYVESGVGAPVVVDLVDSMGLNMSLRVKRTGSPWGRWFWRLEQRRSAAYERRICRVAAASIVVSRRDRAAIGEDGIAVVPNGVAVDAFEYRREGRARGRIAFWGNLRYFSNRDAVLTLVGRIMPRIWVKRPDTIVDVIGPSPPRAVAHARDARVCAPGFVPDLPARVGAATIGVFPIWEASGIQNKVLEALSSGLPVVTTPAVLEGIGARPGGDVLVARTVEEMADEALRLLDDRRLQDSLARNGRNLVEERYTWERSAGQLEQLLIRQGGAGSAGAAPSNQRQTDGA